MSTPSCRLLEKIPIFIFSGHNVVVACLPHTQGKGAAAIVATNMSRTFPKVDLRLLVGIGGGLPSHKHDIRLGDVVISVPEGLHGGVVHFDLGKDTKERFVLKGHLSPVPSILRLAVVGMQSKHRIDPSKINGFLERMIQKGVKLLSYQKPQTKDIPFQRDSLHIAGHETCDYCDTKKTIDRPPRETEYPQIHYGLIASGDHAIQFTYSVVMVIITFAFCARLHTFWLLLHVESNED
ncbi:hypothetical protein BDV19DRAFT_372217 [Aspergillus venezuelensis]